MLVGIYLCTCLIKQLTPTEDIYPNYSELTVGMYTMNKCMRIVIVILPYRPAQRQRFLDTDLDCLKVRYTTIGSVPD